MTGNEDLRTLLRQALPPVEERPPDRDLWPEVLNRRPPARDWSWFDVGAVAAVAMLLTLFPEYLWPLLFHL